MMSLQEIKELILFIKANRVIRFKNDDVEFEFSPDAWEDTETTKKQDESHSRFKSLSEIK